MVDLNTPAIARLTGEDAQGMLNAFIDTQPRKGHEFTMPKKPAGQTATPDRSPDNR